MAKTREEVEQLKRSWASDPCFDLCGGEGFEEYEAELAAFVAEHKARMAAGRKARFIRDGGGAAFPQIPGIPLDGRAADRGMTVRVWLIGQALGGVCASGEPWEPQTIAALAAEAADAVMALLAEEIE